MKPRILQLSAAAMLLAGAITIAIRAHRSDASPSNVVAQTGDAQVSAKATLDGTAPHPLSGKPSSKSPRVLKDEELVAKYGHSRTNLARNVAGNLFAVLGDFLDMGNAVSEMGADEPLAGENKVPAELKGIGGKLALNEAQTVKAAGIFKEHDKRVRAAAVKFIEGMKSDPTPMMEVLLAGDAVKRGKMDEAEFNALQDEVTGDLQSTLGMSDADEKDFGDPLKDETVLRELDALFEPGQREAFQSFLAERPADDGNDVAANEDQDMPLDFTEAMELEQLDKQLQSVKKLSTGMKTILEGVADLDDY